MTTDVPGRAAPPEASADALFSRYRETGDAAALGRLFDRTAQDLFRVAMSLTPDAATAEDAVQETFLAAIEFAARWDASRPVVPWLVGILRHKVEGLRRDAARGPCAVRPPRELPSIDPAGVAALRDDADRVRAAMDALPEPYRQAALLRWRHGLEPAEIAHLTGASPGAIRVRLHRAMARLRERVRGGAVLALLPGVPRELRGLDAVRGAVMGRARVAPHVGVGAGAAAGAVVGGMTMAGKGAIAAACVVLAVAGAAWWALSDGGSAGRSGASDAATAAAPEDSRDHARAAAPVADATPVAAAPAAAPSVPDGPTITGRVIDSSGRGVAGARVVAVASGTKDLVRADLLDVPTDVAASATSAADGAFVVAARGGGRTFDVLATADGFGPAWNERVRTGTSVEIRMDAEWVLRGRVVGPDATPVAGAELRLVRVTRGVADERAARSADDGTFRLGGFAPRATPRWAPVQPVTHTLGVRAAGFATLRAPVEPEVCAAPREIVLMRGGTLTVSVTDGETSAAIEGATVTYGDAAVGVLVPDWENNVRTVPHPNPHLGVAATGADGRAVFADAPSERANLRLFVRAWKEGFTAEATSTDDSGGAEALSVTLALWPSTTVRGRVVDATGAPVAGATISSVTGAPDWFPAPFGDRPWPGGVKTGADGRYALPCVRAGRVAPIELTLQAMPPWGEAVGDAAFTSRDRVRTKVAARAGGDTAAPDMVMGTPRATPRAVVLVTDAAGAPVEDAAVASIGANLAVVRTGADGRAVVGWSVDPIALPPSMWTPAGPRPERIVRVSAPGFATAEATCVPAADPPPQVAVTLAPAQALIVVVRTASGAPAAGSAVWATTGEGDAAHSVEGVETAPGTFRFTGIGASPVDLHARAAPTGRDPPVTVVPGVVAGGAPVEVVVAEDSVGTGTVEGTVRDAATGAPVAGFEVEIPSQPFPVNGWGDPLTAGTFRIEHVPAGTWAVRVRPRGRLAEETSVAVTRGATSRVEVRVSRGVAVTGRVRVPEGVVTDMPRIDLRRIDVGPGDPHLPGPQGWSWIKDGAFRMDAVRPGRYVAVVALHRGGPRTPQDVRVGAAQIVVPAGRTDPLELDLTLVTAGMIVVKVDDPGVPPVPPDADETEAEPPRDCPVEFLDAKGGRVAIERGFWRGGGTAAHVAPGEYVVVLHVPGQAPRREKATVVAGATADVVFGAR